MRPILHFLVYRTRQCIIASKKKFQILKPDIVPFSIAVMPIREISACETKSSFHVSVWQTQTR